MATLTDTLLAAAEEIKGLALLRHVAREAAALDCSSSRRVATRPTGHDTALARTLADVAPSRSVRTVRIAPFTPAEVAEYLDEVPGGSPVAAEVVARTGGLPLLVAAVAGVGAGAPGPTGARVEVPAADLRLRSATAGSSEPRHYLATESTLNPAMPEGGPA